MFTVRSVTLVAADRSADLDLSARAPASSCFHSSLRICSTSCRYSGREGRYG